MIDNILSDVSGVKVEAAGYMFESVLCVHVILASAHRVRGRRMPRASEWCRAPLIMTAAGRLCPLQTMPLQYFVSIYIKRIFLPIHWGTYKLQYVDTDIA